MKPTFYMLCGLPASGKSTVAKKLSEDTGAVIHSSDDLRKELYKDENFQDKNNELFLTLHRRIKDDLRNEISVVYDATNISYKKRKAFLSELTNIECKRVCIIVATPYKECLTRNQERDRKVPDEVIKNMYTHWNIPYWYEGWDDIEIEYTVDTCYFGSPLDVIDKYINYDQQNYHHKLTLGWHLEQTLHSIQKRKRHIMLSNNDLSKTNYLRVAAVLHDCGKPFVQIISTELNDIDEFDAHYYQHHCVGAYDSLFYEAEYNSINHAVLIQWHMQPYSWERDEVNGEKQRLKYKKLWGNDLYEDIMLLHETDVLAHEFIE